ncbi:protein YgfX [Aliivibrio finisterrensis]
MSTTSANSAKIKIHFSYIAYLTLYGSYFYLGWAVMLMDIIPFPLLPTLFYFIHQHIISIYHQLLELQGDYTFVIKASDDHRDWIIKRVFWISRSMSVFYAENEYTKQYFYLFRDAMNEDEQHQLAVLLR